jgi:hypothetical protein
MRASEKMGGALPLLGAFLLSSCFYFGKNDFEDVVQEPPEKWSTRDCLTIVMGVAQDNLSDPRSPNIKVVAIPYYPSVVAAIERRAHILGPLQYQPFTYRHTEEAYRHHLDTMMALEAGVYVDWSTGRYVDSRGNYLRDPTQLDYLMFYISFTNTNWPFVPFDEVTDISNLEKNIFLVNDQDTILTPRSASGKQRTILTMEETLLVMFDLRNKDYHFFKNSREMRLVIKGFRDPIELKFPISRVR